MMGGFGTEKDVTDEIKAIANEVKEHVETKLGKSYDTWEPVSYKTQVVAGTNYLVKVKVSDNECVHVKIFKALPCNGGAVTLSEATGGHGATDTL
jgi:cystatin-A/B